MIFKAKSIFLWNTPAVENGDPARIAARLTAAGFEAVYLHTNDGVAIPTWNFSGSPYPGYGENVKDDLVRALKAAGLKVMGWGAIYGLNPLTEAAQAARQVARLGLDGYVFDAESAWENRSGAVANTLQLLREFRRAVDCPVAWCSWAFFKNPSTGGRWHVWEVVEAAMSLADVGMPMTYWWGESADQALWMLEQSTRQWRGYCQGKPVVAVGRAYNGDGGTARAEAVLAAGDWARANLEGISWWSMEHALRLPGIWPALEQTPGFVTAEPPVEELTLEEKVNRLYTEAIKRGWTV